MIGAPAANRSDRIWLFAYVAFFAALSLVKAPNVLVDPRFWAEDGAFYFTNFRALDAWGALFYITNGNYQFLTNVLVYLATKVPLVHAPAITTYGAYLVDTLVVVLIHAVVASYGINRHVGLLLVAGWTLMPASYERPGRRQRMSNGSVRSRCCWSSCCRTRRSSVISQRRLSGRRSAD